MPTSVAVAIAVIIISPVTSEMLITPSEYTDEVMSTPPIVTVTLVILPFVAVSVAEYAAPLSTTLELLLLVTFVRLFVTIYGLSTSIVPS